MNGLLKKKRVFLIFFLYSALLAVFVQFLALPHIFPHLHTGEGLLKGLDSKYFHNEAKIIAKKIQNEGWVVWQLRPPPRGNAPIGITSAIYAATIPKPWVLIPINSTLHAGAGLLLYLILFSISRDKKSSFFATIPFIIFPSSLTWVTQIHKDGFSIFGAFATLYGLMKFAQSYNNKSRLMAILLVWCGTFSTWIVRPYLVKIYSALLAIYFAALMGENIWSFCKKRKDMKQFAGYIVLLSLLFAAPNIINQKNILYFNSIFNIWEKTSYPSNYRPPVALTKNPVDAHGDSYDALKPPKFSKKELNSPFPLNIYYKLKYKFYNFDKKVTIRLNQIRRGFVTTYPKAGTNIDTERYFSNIDDIVSYTPRALQILFFAPFPSSWLEKGFTAAGTYMRKATMLEMAVAYFSFLFLPLCLWKWRASPFIWLMLAFCTLLILPLGFAVPNVGAIHRMRYMGFMCIVCFGILGALTTITQLKHRESYDTKATTEPDNSR